MRLPPVCLGVPGTDFGSATRAVALLCSTPVRARWAKLEDLGAGSLGRQSTWERCFESSRYFSIPGDGAAAAAEAANGFSPPWLLIADCSDGF
jgi:hypothetical protein